jgi:hypothetical protein
MIESVRIAILSAHDEVIGFLDNGAKDGLGYYNDELKEFLQGSASIFTFTSSTRHETSINLVVGNKLAFKYGNRDYYLSIVKDRRDEYEVGIEAFSTNLELLNETVGPYSSPRAMTFVEYVNAFQFERVLTVGRNEVANASISNEWQGSSTILARLFSLANVFSAEIEFVPVLNDDFSLRQITLNIYRQHSETSHGIGEHLADTILRFGREVEGVTRTSDITNLFTAIRPRGRDGLTVAGLNRTELDEYGNVEFFTSTGDIAIRAPQARNRFPSNVMANTTDRYIAFDWEYDTPNVNMLYGQALGMLRRNCIPQVSYDVKGYFNTAVGDTVRIVDDEFNPPLTLNARVIEQTLSMTDPNKARTYFDNFTELQSEISPNLRELMNRLFEENRVFSSSIITDNGIVFRNSEGETTLTSLVMDRGQNITDRFAINWFRGDVFIDKSEAITILAIDVPDRAVFRFEALDENGVIRASSEVTIVAIEDGESGVVINSSPSAIVIPCNHDGLVRNILEFTVAFNAFRGGSRLEVAAEAGSLPDGMTVKSNTPASFTQDGALVFEVAEGSHLGSANLLNGFFNLAFETEEVSTNRLFTWAKSIEGLPGDKGAPGVGVDYITAYFLATNQTEDVDFNTPGWSTDVPTLDANARNLWTYEVTTMTDGTTLTSIPRIIGTFSQDGQAGVGISSTAVTYAPSTSGITAPTANWQSSIPTVPAGQFLWTRTVITFTNNTSSTSFSVSRIGIDGDDGTPGRGVQSTSITYQSGTSGTVAPTGTWQTTVPTVAQGNFLWTRNITTFTDNTTTTSFSVARQGANGTNGTPGRGVQSTAITYQAGANGTTPPTGTWQTAIPPVTAGQFLWTRTITTFTDSTTTTAFSVARQGSNGTNGAPGRGVQSTAITYQAWANMTTTPTGAWSPSIPVVPQGHFLWTRIITTFTDSTTSTAFSVARQGANGSDGDSGIIVSAAAPSNPTLNQLWQTSTGAPIRRWNGTAWVVHHISVENLEVDQLSALSANLGTVTAGKIRNVEGTVNFDVDEGELTTERTWQPQPPPTFGTTVHRTSSLHEGTLINETSFIGEAGGQQETLLSTKTVIDAGAIKTSVSDPMHDRPEYMDLGEIIFPRGRTGDDYWLRDSAGVIDGTIGQRLIGLLRALIPPVGWIELTFTNTNPSTRYPGTTWVAHAPGRVLVGVGSNGTTNYTAAGTTGGSDNVTLTAAQSGIREHNHPLDRGGGMAITTRGAGASSINGLAEGGAFNQAGVNGGIRRFSVGVGNRAAANAQQAHENRMPFTTVFMWRRTR